MEPGIQVVLASVVFGLLFAHVFFQSFENALRISGHLLANEGNQHIKILRIYFGVSKPIMLRNQLDV